MRSMRQNSSLPKKRVSALDFKCSSSTWIRFSPDSSKQPAIFPTDYKWKDYSPTVFRHLQELNEIDASHYKLSICQEESLKAITLHENNGSRHYLSIDERFVVKILRKSEMKALLDMLPHYYYYVQIWESTLLTKFYGLHSVSSLGSRKVYFVVVANIFDSELPIHRRFDLKGSCHGRQASRCGIDKSVTLKDLDLDLVFHLDTETRDQLLMQIRRDCSFLEREGIMDYSFLLGIHMRSLSNYCSSVKGKANTVEFGSSRPSPKDGKGTPAVAKRARRDESRNGFLQLGAEKGTDVILYFGIIDILQQYNAAKRFEHAYKSIQFDSQSISAVNPKTYAARLQEFLSRVFPRKSDDCVTLD
ncbi:hypothetical protein H6P81_014484 [Aristolochia fimbriata]|uniref:1-phosphatidylinositol-4-phosphate 5-kinase n=1 Tax=Aristolochia fimbriata TaxID=158543 RepID=A0AAV7EIU9_ARIFI|nr:hypothetical protein H6P81_014484 [Aristolochia fimbriata]